MTSYRPGLLLAALIIAISAIAVWYQGMDAVRGETGGIEVMSTVALLAALVLFLKTLGSAAVRQYWYGTLALIALAARELDLDKAFFDKGILSLKHYSGDAPVIEKLIGLAVVIVLLVVGITLLRRGTRPLLRGVRQQTSAAWLLSGAILLAVFGKSLDGIARKLGGFGAELSTRTVDLAQIAEETAELAAAICLMLAVVRLPLRPGTAHPNKGMRNA